MDSVVKYFSQNLVRFLECLERVLFNNLETRSTIIVKLLTLAKVKPQDFYLEDGPKCFCLNYDNSLRRLLSISKILSLINTTQLI